MNFCKDCVHSVSPNNYYRCMRPLGKYDPVTGEEKKVDRACSVERSSPFFFLYECGKIGRFFKKKGKE